MYLIKWFQKANIEQIEFIRKYDKQGWSPIDSIIHLPFHFIKEKIPKLIEENKFEEAFSLTLSKSIDEVLKIKPVDRFRFLIWLEIQYSKINKMEEQNLSSPPDMKMLSAGIKDLDILGYKNAVDLLAGGDVTKWEKVKNLPYEVCFEKQLKITIETKIQKKLIELNKQK